jgi:hypothetical protein
MLSVSDSGSSMGLIEIYMLAIDQKCEPSYES